jgi:hypothetical protein
MADHVRISKDLAEELLQVLDMAQHGTLKDDEDFAQAADAYESLWAVIIETLSTTEDG